MGRVLPLISSVVAGALAGIGGSLIAAPHLPSAAANASSIHSVELPTKSAEAAPALSSPLPSTAAGGVSAPAPVFVPPRPASAEPPPEAEAERARFHEKLIADHKADPVDRAWAPTAKKTLEQDLIAKAESKGYEVVEVDCRTTTCTSLLRWPSYTNALKSGMAVTSGQYELNCTRELYMPRPSDGEDPYQATLVMDCKNLRN